MVKLGHDNRDLCAQVLDALEMIDPRAEESRSIPAEEFRSSLLRELPEEWTAHLSACSNCQDVLEDFANTQEALRPLAREVDRQQPGPWFASKVMNAIREQESEINLKDAVWISVRRFAPRLAAVCAVLLLVMGTWMAREVKMDQVRSAQNGWESLFDSGSSPMNDDVLVYGSEAHR